MLTSIIITDAHHDLPITVLEGEIALGPWLFENGFGLISLNEDPDGVFGYIAVVEADDFLSIEAITKLEIAMELAELEEDDTEDFSIPEWVDPVAFTPAKELTC